MKKTFIYTACIAFLGFFSLTTFAQNVAVIDTQAAILQTQVAQDAFKALEEDILDTVGPNFLLRI